MTWESALEADEEWDEPTDDYLQQASQVDPWSQGQDGKGLLLPSRTELAIWAVDEMGEPHHDDVGIPYVAKLDVFPSGAVTIMSPDAENLFGISREEAESALASLAPRYGLFFKRAFVARGDHRDPPWELLGVEPQPQPHAVRAQVGVDVPARQRPVSAALAAVGDPAGIEQMDHRPIIACPTCGDPLQGDYGTHCPRCHWSEHNVNLDHDPLSNPPDPTRDLHRGIQSRWFEAVEDAP